MFDVVAAVLEQSYGIGANGGLPWPPHAKDRAHVKSLTTGGVLIMGRKTFESIPNGLPEREIIVVTSRTNPSIANTCPNLQAALDMAANVFPSKPVFVFGGARLYAEAMLHHECRRMYITWMCHHHQTLSPDTFFPRFDHWTETMSYEIDSEQPARFCVYERAESQYLRLVRQALRVPDSSRRVDRTQIGT
jgi:dihydrofolate reductase